MDLLSVGPNPRGGRLPSWKISNNHVSGMGYLIHFHELESSFGGIGEYNALPIVCSQRTTSSTGLCFLAVRTSLLLSVCAYRMLFKY